MNTLSEKGSVIKQRTGDEMNHKIHGVGGWALPVLKNITVNLSWSSSHLLIIRLLPKLEEISTAFDADVEISNATSSSVVFFSLILPVDLCTCPSLLTVYIPVETTRNWWVYPIWIIKSIVCLLHLPGTCGFPQSWGEPQIINFQALHLGRLAWRPKCRWSEGGHYLQWQWWTVGASTVEPIDNVQI